METYTVALYSGAFFEKPSGAMVPVDLEHWRPLVRYFAARCNRFRADCWLKDAALLDMFEPYAEQHSPGHVSPAFAIGRLAPELLETILNEPFDSDGAVKWFTLFLKEDDATVLTSAHNGAEIYLSEVSGEELAWIRSILPEDVRVNAWTAEEMARMWGDRPVPVVQHGIDEVCLPAQPGGLDLNAIAGAMAETLERVSPKTEQDDIAAAPNDSLDTTIVHALLETLVRVLSKPEQQGIAAAESDSTGSENQ